MRVMSAVGGEPEAMMTEDQFWQKLKEVYDVLARRSFIGERRYGVRAGEVRRAFCGMHNISAGEFDCLASELYRSREHYTKFELIGCPPHRKPSRSETITVDGAEYTYMVIHL